MFCENGTEKASYQRRKFNDSNARTSQGFPKA
jgi:hypothetical protein